MKLQELYEKLNTVGIPVAYSHFIDEDNINPPFIVYFETSAQSISGDDCNFGKRTNITIRLCTNVNDLELESKLEKAINCFSFYKNKTYISGEEIFQIAYEIENIEKEYQNNG